MKTLLFVICTIACLSVSAQSNEQSIRVMTYNIRLDAKSDEERGWGWNQRREYLCNLIRFINPDLLGVQEAMYNQMEFMEKQLIGYKWIGKGRNDGDKAGEFSAIFYKTDKFELLQSGTFWLSETPEIAGSKGWDAAYTRVCTWGKFKQKSTGKLTFVFNTHFDHIGVTARKESALLIMKKMKELGASEFCILLGDFNSNPKSEAYQTFVNTSKSNTNSLLDCSLLAKDVKIQLPYTFTGFDVCKTTPELIDFVFVNKPTEVLNYVTLPVSVGQNYISDHQPVIVDFILK